MTDEGIHRLAQDLVPMVIIVAGIIAATRVFAALIAYYRNRAHLRAQTEFHNRMLDKFGTAEEFTTYLQSDAGKSFFENLANEPVAPLTKIFGSIQKGAILTLLGVGLTLLSQAFLPFDSGSVMLVAGVVALTVGGGFLASSAIAYRLAKTWGLVASADAGSAPPRKTAAPNAS